MDGFHLSPPRAATRRIVAATLTLLAIAGGAGTALADDAPTTTPAARWPAAGPAVHTAMELGVQRWGFSPCHGRVTVAWAALDAGLNADASWTNDAAPYLQPSRNDDCSVTLSTRVDWDWPKLCSVVIHELGHLAGHDHIADPDDVMYFTYVQPIPECLDMPEPVNAIVTAPAAPPTASATTRRATNPKAGVKTTTNVKARTPAAKRARRPAAGHRAKHPRSRR